MKYFSEKLNKVFDTEKELKTEEAKLDFISENPDDNLLDVKTVETKEENSVSKTPSRKQLAADVDSADLKLKEAYANYDVAKQKVEDLLKKYQKDVDDILDPAKEAVRKAEQDRYDAIRRFNDSYGPYQVVYTGDRAAQEMFRALNEINNIHKRMFRDSFWF